MIINPAGQDYYKKQVELAKICGVSEGTISNWINKAKDSKNLLQLIEIKDRFYIAKNEHNISELKKLTEEATNYQNIVYKDIYPKEELYDTLSESQTISLINSLKTKGTAPCKFVFMGNGAIKWDKLYSKIHNSDNYGSPTKRYLFEKTINFFEEYISKFDSVIITDLGCGNFKPAKPLLEKIEKSGKLDKYICIDISKDMIEIAKTEFSKDFDENKFVGHVLDLELHSTEEALLKQKNNAKKSVNILLMFGGTIGNIENQVKVFNHIKDGMHPEDLLMIANAYDEIDRRTVFPAFDFEEGFAHVSHAACMLNIDKGVSIVEKIYNSNTTAREVNLIIKENIKINFTRYNDSINIKSGESINIWKHKRDTFELVSNKIRESDMELQFIVKHPTEAQMLYVARLA